MITIEKRKIEVSIPEFKEEVKELCRLLKRNSRNTIGIGEKTLNSHFKTKLTVTDFYILTEQLEYRLYSTTKGKYWSIEDILKED
ncbi:hypothetical protein EG346_16730 [Chryseobacterium carnipullorum]|uniref:Uncharacterized protein n=1 Tax=Chryseobacterium carnipullorum TaxID=1124835 RepID=A0A376DUH6_CHRCU|nr:hypothetical protein [Chryseobacterium carnipullorum]AZA49722.1 hypothetical protein EG346_16730 [Chryseobacterium carnipullorum]STC95418.1 Uncharacterised protein [Chryseobacterium carnipullorum]